MKLTAERLIKIQQSYKQHLVELPLEQQRLNEATSKEEKARIQKRIEEKLTQIKLLNKKIHVLNDRFNRESNTTILEAQPSGDHGPEVHTFCLDSNPLVGYRLEHPMLNDFYSTCPDEVRAPVHLCQTKSNDRVVEQWTVACTDDYRLIRPFRDKEWGTVSSITRAEAEPPSEEILELFRRCNAFNQSMKCGTNESKETTVSIAIMAAALAILITAYCCYRKYKKTHRHDSDSNQTIRNTDIELSAISSDERSTERRRLLPSIFQNPRESTHQTSTQNTQPYQHYQVMP